MPAKNSRKVYVENGYYHIYNRGVEKRVIYPEEPDYKVFLSYLKLYLEPPHLQGQALQASPSRHPLKNYADQINLLSYCLMPNHFHFLIRQTVPNAMNQLIQSLLTKYSMYINKKYHRVGPLFQGRYKAVLVKSEPQFLYLTKYIHRNPLNILPTWSKLEDYPYSSYPNYLNTFQQIWLKPQEVLSHFSQTNPALSYKTFVEETDELGNIEYLTLDA